MMSKPDCLVIRICPELKAQLQAAAGSGCPQRLKLFGKEAPPLILLYILLQPVFLLLDLAKLQK